MCACVPLPPGEGGAERRVRVWECVNPGPSSGPFLEASPYRARASRGHPLPKGEGHALRFSLIWPTVVIDRASCLVSIELTAGQLGFSLARLIRHEKPH